MASNQFRSIGGWTLSTGCDSRYFPIRDITWPNQESYAYKWGMNWRPEYWQQDVKWAPSWHRIQDMMECMDRGTEYVVCLDTDAVFVDDSEWIGDAIGDKSVYMAYQILDGFIFPSCGFMVVRNDATGREWVESLHRLRHRFADDLWCEQAVAYHLLGYNPACKSPMHGQPWQRVTEWTDRVGFLPRRWHSTPQDPVAAPIVFHATGGVDVGVQARVAQLDKALAGVVQ